MKKAISLLLSVLLVGSLAGFTKISSPVHMFEPAVERTAPALVEDTNAGGIARVFASAVEKTAAAPALDVVQRSDSVYISADGSSTSCRTDTVTLLRRTPQGLEMTRSYIIDAGSEKEERTNYYYKGGCFYQESEEGRTQGKMDEALFWERVMPVLGGGIQPEWLNGGSIQQIGMTTQLTYHLTSDQQARYLNGRTKAVGIFDPVPARADLMRCVSDIGADGLLLHEEHRTQITVFPGEEGMSTNRATVRSWYSYPANPAPLDFPDELETGWDE